MKKGQSYKVDSYLIKQYEGERFVDTVVVIETRKKFERTVLCYSSKYMANVLIPTGELKII